MANKGRAVVAEISQNSNMKPAIEQVLIKYTLFMDGCILNFSALSF